MYAHGLRAPFLWALALYALCAIFSNASHGADYYFGLWNTTASATAECNVDRTAAGVGSGCTVNNNTAGMNCHVNGFPDATHWRRYLHGGNSYFYCSINTGSCPVGLDDVGGNLCEEPPALSCADASEDDVDETLIQSENPGLCAFGDFIEVSSTVCQFSESAGQNCEVVITEEVRWVNGLPPEFWLSTVWEFQNVACGTVTSPDPYEFEECPPPPHSCPEGFTAVEYAGEWSCEPNSEDPIPDTETPPIPPTNTYTSTTTTTTTTTTNPDGSVTTVAESETEVGECAEGADCTMELDFEGPGDLLGPVKTFTETTAAFWNTVQDSAFMAAVSAWADYIIESPTCPTWSAALPLVDTTMEVDGHCEAIAPITDEIQVIFLFVWALMGVFIILSA